MSKIDWNKGRVEMVHGSGGRAMMNLISELFAKELSNEWLDQGNDGALLPAPEAGHKLVMATDSHVITPLFFPGGDIGSLAVHGTVNDLAMMGAKPLYLSAGFILEEGFPLADLRKIVQSMAAAAREAGVAVVTGDTKVVEQGKGDGVFINTTGVGQVPDAVVLSGAQAQPGDKILVSGSIGDHGVTILSCRESLGFESDLQSDSQSLNGLVSAMLDAVQAQISAGTCDANALRCLRDPTRGGVANTLNEIAHQSSVGIHLQEAEIPVKPPVAAACEFLGLDPLYVANEGKLLAICAPELADTLLEVMRTHPAGTDAAIIGEALVDENNFVQMTTKFGGRRMVDWLNGEQLPRIC
ncbi:MAG: hydrogenase expression/formation protein HypE [Oceanobacter sp.]